MKRLILPFFIGVLFMLFSCGGEKSPHAIIKTDLGDIKVKLFESTPRHTEQFITLAKRGFYDGLIFHRILKGFMIQGGNTQIRTEEVAAEIAQNPAEIDHEIGEYHFRGSLCAARTPNPEKRSGSQFYIVDGSPVTDQMLDNYEKRSGVSYTAAERELYKQVGGAPQLDGDYTVFGEVVSGIEVVDKIAAAPAPPNPQGSRPFDDIKMKVYIVYE
ncbi:MAG: peptidylprolyl isomerase [Saprospiraceae bacterium]